MTNPWLLIDLVDGGLIDLCEPCPDQYVESFRDAFAQVRMIYKQVRPKSPSSKGAIWTYATAGGDPKHHITLTDGGESCEHRPTSWLAGDVLWESFLDGTCDIYGRGT